MQVMSREPVLTVSTLAAAIVTVCAIFHVVLDTSAVETVLAVLVPLVAALIARAHVTPAKSR